MRSSSRRLPQYEIAIHQYTDYTRETTTIGSELYEEVQGIIEGVDSSNENSAEKVGSSLGASASVRTRLILVLPKISRDYWATDSVAFGCSELRYFVKEAKFVQMSSKWSALFTSSSSTCV